MHTWREDFLKYEEQVKNDPSLAEQEEREEMQAVEHMESLKQQTLLDERDSERFPIIKFLFGGRNEIPQLV